MRVDLPLVLSLYRESSPLSFHTGSTEGREGNRTGDRTPKGVRDETDRRGSEGSFCMTGDGVETIPVKIVQGF